MTPIDIPTIERQARALRAQEIQRLQGLFAERLRLYFLLLGHSLLALIGFAAESLRPVFSWNPQQPAQTTRPSLGIRLNRLARRLFAWNPRSHRHC
jgi:hypothetical protein